MNILDLNHVALFVQDLERSRRFYCEVLGMQEIPSGGNCFLRKGSAEVHLLGAPEGRSVELHYHADDLADGYITHFAFEIDDLEKAQEHLRDYNIQIVCGPRPRFDGKEQLYFCDPDGYIIELFGRKK